MRIISMPLLLLLSDCYTAGRGISLAFMALASFGLGGWLLKVSRATPVGERKGLRRNAYQGEGVKVRYAIMAGWFIFCGLLALLALIFRMGC